MTYCVAARVNAGIVFLSDSRTNAGVDQISTFRKMTVFEHPGERLLVLLSAGNVAITQAVRQIVCERVGPQAASVWNARTLFEAARVLGEAVREVRTRDAQALQEAGIEFNCSFILGGQITGEAMRLFNVYGAGNFIEATDENLYFQIGESKDGKPIIDRVILADKSLDAGIPGDSRSELARRADAARNTGARNRRHVAGARADTGRSGRGATYSSTGHSARGAGRAAWYAAMNLRAGQC